jgi:hypothetical protein
MDYSKDVISKNFDWRNAIRKTTSGNALSFNSSADQASTAHHWMAWHHQSNLDYPETVSDPNSEMRCSGVVYQLGHLWRTTTHYCSGGATREPT